MNRHERFWALESGTAETVLRGIELSLAERPDPQAMSGTSEPRQYASFRNGSVAVVNIEGPLSRTAIQGWWGETLAQGYDDIHTVIGLLVEDPNVSAILLNIDSPGGSVSGVQELADFVAECSKKKPMASFTNGLMASAAYWLGSSTGRVFATETAEVGSIGVIMTLYDQVRANEKAGLNVHVISSGRLKAAGNPHSELTEEQRMYFQSQADGIHSVFRGSVSSRMGLDMEKAEEWGDGQVFLAKNALDNGLVTKVVSGLEAAIKQLSEEVPMDRASLEAQAPELVAELIAEGRAQAESEHLQDVFLAAARQFLSDEQSARIDEFMKACTTAKLSREQAEAMLSVSFISAQAAKAEPEKKEAVTEAAAPEAKAILDAIQAKSPQGVPAGADSVTPKTFRSCLLEAAEHYGE